jgi:CheY-like chemotaxis protein
MKPRQVDVLIVEDQQFDVELILRALYVHAPDLTAAVATTATAAIDYLQTHSPKAILLDLHLPDADGCELLRRIKQDSRYDGIPIIVLTGSGGERHRNEANQLGVSGYINKTADIQTLAEHLILSKYLLQKKLNPSRT